MKYFFVHDKKVKDNWYIIEGETLDIHCTELNQGFYYFGKRKILYTGLPRNRFSRTYAEHRFSPQLFGIGQYNELNDLISNHFADML